MSDYRLSFCEHASTDGTWFYCDHEGGKCEKDINHSCLAKASNEWQSIKKTEENT